MRDNTGSVFFELLKAGLWGEADANLNVHHNLFEGVDWQKAYQLAQEQSVLGLVLAGLEQYKNFNANLDLNIPKVLLLQWIGEVQIIEKQNKDMNAFIAELIEKLRKEDIYAILVKGQGIAQCYNRPNWRLSGDVDLLLSKDNYEKAKAFLLPLGDITEPEEARKKHFAMQIEQWTVELHGSLHVGLSARVDRMLDNVQRDVFHRGEVRSVVLDVNDNLNDNGTTKSFKSVQVFLPAANEDVVYVFAHILQHFYKGGIGLRQICDWCRLLWTYRESLNHEYLESKIREAGLMSEWKAFYNLASRYLGMPDL
ncbi:MAG: nucleotidyltransferase family protein, partial [Pseudobutyrivibrio sp.]|nr:nucleotidyltransferase family protein [Pseudobutyrivibrio sp.]